MSKLNVHDKFVGNIVKERSRVCTVLVEGPQNELIETCMLDCRSPIGTRFCVVCRRVRFGRSVRDLEVYRGDVAKTAPSRVCTLRVCKRILHNRLDTIHPCKRCEFDLRSHAGFDASSVVFEAQLYSSLFIAIIMVSI